MKLQYKLLAAFLLMSLLILALTAGIMHVTMKRNFVRYVHNTTFDRMETVFELLEQHYRTHRSWDALKNIRNWTTLLHEGLAEQDGFTGRPAFDQSLPQPGGGPARNGRFPQPGPAPAHPKGGFPEGPAPPDNGPETPLHMRLCLFDADKHLVAGHMAPDSEFIYWAVTLSGKPIGWLGLQIPPTLENPLGLQFLKQQANAFYLIASGILVMAILISWLLSRMLLAPVRELVRGTRALKSFDFDVEIRPRSNDELGLLAEDFNQMARTIRQYETMRKNWLSDISHELRTPIAVLQSKLEAVQDGIRQMTPTMLSSLHTDTKGLGRLVENLHLLAMADSRSLNANKRPLDVAVLLRDSLESFRVRLDEKKVRLELPGPRPPCIILADPHHLARVLGNLAENTLRYTDPPGQLQIGLESDTDRIRIYFEDSHPGVPPDALDRIFDRLYRVDKSRSRALGGSGLGLSICRQIIEDHNGSISAGLSGLGGLKITIELPLTGK